MKNKTMLFLLMLSFSYCTPVEKKSNQPVLDDFSWLLGRWSNISSEGRFYETWTQSNDSVFTGTSFLIVDADTVFAEEITLKSDSNGIYYSPKVKGQNNEMAVSFKLISSKGEWVFENKEHDFPNKIIYSNPAKDSLYARIEGNKNGQFRKEEFAFNRE
jgi:hypothetical protein